MRLPRIDSTTAKTTRVILYQVAGLLLATLANPDAVTLIKNYFPDVLILLGGVAPVATLIVNLLRPDVKNY